MIPKYDNNFYNKIPTWDNGVWRYTYFGSTDEFIKFLEPLFKEPGEYQFDDTSFLFNEQARNFDETGFFTEHKEGTEEHEDYYETEKEKSRFGVIFKNGDKTWYLSRNLYFWINFLQINDKKEQRLKFPDFWDVHYHIALYELLAELNGEHVVITKKRQIGSSLYYMAKIINLLWFEEKPVMKMGASQKGYVLDSWTMLDEYKSFLNLNTGWYRPMTPDKTLSWLQQIEYTDENGRSSMIGLKGSVKGLSFEKSATAGVGGALRLFFHEEAGEAPKMDTTLEFLLPAMKSGDITTGLFVASGSVGQLSKAEPLKNLMYKPKENGFRAVYNKYYDSTEEVRETGLFIPEQWSMPPYIDEYGNSLVDEALESLTIKFKKWKKELSPSSYQLRVSQHPRTLEEAFDYREESQFPIHLIKAQERRINDNQYHTENVELYIGDDGLVKYKTSNKAPISDYPISHNQEDKTGCVVMHEKPKEGLPFGSYYASVDPVAVGKTTSSESLFSIYIYRRKIEEKKDIGNGEYETSIIPDVVVAWWCGRFDDINKTHERAEMLIELYNAWTIVENNVREFITYMINKNKQRYLVPKNQMVFLKQLGGESNGYQEYGWRNVSTIFKDSILPYFKSFLKEIIDEEVDEETGKVYRKVYGIERIPDIMAMKEMKAYDGKVNVDRIISLASLIAFAKIQEANRAMIKHYKDEADLENKDDLYKFNIGAFSNIGKNKSMSQRKYRSGFKNLR